MLRITATYDGQQFVAFGSEEQLESLMMPLCEVRPPEGLVHRGELYLNYKWPFDFGFTSREDTTQEAIVEEFVPIPEPLAYRPKPRWTRCSPGPRPGAVAVLVPSRFGQGV